MNSPASICPPASGSSLGLLIRQTRDAIWQAMEKELVAAGHDLTFSQFVTIKKLADGIASVTDLARAAEVHPGAMTRLLDRLETRGLVVRQADPGDRRALHIHLTDAGTAIWQDINLCGQRILQRATRGMSEAESSELMRLLELARNNLTSETV
ncbi:MAG: MarR family transcriptional regulator [Pseudoxanthomonas sp.]|jgi:DNA-binding MarR family transcriptional regulator